MALGKHDLDREKCPETQGAESRMVGEALMNGRFGRYCGRAGFQGGQLQVPPLKIGIGVK